MNKELKLPFWVLLAIFAIFTTVCIVWHSKYKKEANNALEWKSKYNGCKTQQYAKEQLNKADSLIQTIEEIPAADAKEYLKNKYKNNKTD